jgi:hypothetical protein
MVYLDIAQSKLEIVNNILEERNFRTMADRIRALLAHETLTGNPGNARPMPFPPSIFSLLVRSLRRHVTDGRTWRKLLLAPARPSKEDSSVVLSAWASDGLDVGQVQGPTSRQIATL